MFQCAVGFSGVFWNGLGCSSVLLGFLGVSALVCTLESGE